MELFFKVSAPSRKKGELSEILQRHLPTLPEKDRKMTKLMLEFWVARKDRLFAEHNWPIDVEAYKNVKDEVIVRVLVREPKHYKPDLQPEWQRAKPPSQVLPLNVLAKPPHK